MAAWRSPVISGVLNASFIHSDFYCSCYIHIQPSKARVGLCAMADTELEVSYVGKFLFFYKTSVF